MPLNKAANWAYPSLRRPRSHSYSSLLFLGAIWMRERPGRASFFAMPPATQASDRELLIRIDERIASLQTDFVELKQDVKEKASITSVNKLQRRVNKNDRRLSYICGGLIVIEAAMKYLKLPWLPSH